MSTEKKSILPVRDLTKIRVGDTVVLNAQRSPPVVTQVVTVGRKYITVHSRPYTKFRKDNGTVDGFYGLSIQTPEQVEYDAMVKKAKKNLEERGVRLDHSIKGDRVRAIYLGLMHTLNMEPLF